MDQERQEFFTMESKPIYSAWLHLTISVLASASLGNVENLREVLVEAVCEAPIKNEWEVEERQRISVIEAQDALAALVEAFLTAFIERVGGDAGETIQRILREDDSNA